MGDWRLSADNTKAKCFEAVLYRGVLRHNVRYILTPSSEGTFGSGLYLADYKCAACFADDGYIIELGVSLANPYHFTVPDDDGDFGEVTGIPLVREVLPSRATSLINDLIDRKSYYFGREIEEALTHAGHDGLVVTHPGGSQEVVLYGAARSVLTDIIVPCGDDKAASTTLKPAFLTAHFRAGIDIYDWLEQLEHPLDAG